MRRLLEEALILEEALRYVRRILLVDLNTTIQLGDVFGGQQRADLIQKSLGFVVDSLTYHGCDVFCRLQALVVFEDDPTLVGDHTLSREQQGYIDLAPVERSNGQWSRDVEGLEFAELDAVDILQSDKTERTIRTLGWSTEDEVLCFAGKVTDCCQPEIIRRLGGDYERVLIVCLRRFQQNQAVLLDKRLEQIEILLGIAGCLRLRVEEEQQRSQVLGCEIDLAPEYLGSLLLFLDPKAKASGDPQENFDLLQPLVEEDGLVLLEPSEANDQNAFVVTSETSDDLGLTTVSDLAGEAQDLILGGPPECPDRPFCLIGLKDVYGVEFGEFKPLDIAGPLTVAALDGGKIDVALLFSTQSVIADKGWVVLEDDKSLQTAENITPVVGEAVDDEAQGLLNEVSALLTTENITELNGRVEIDKEDPADVAQSFLEDEGLL